MRYLRYLPVVFVLFLAACGGGSEGGSGAAPTPTPTPTPAPSTFTLQGQVSEEAPFSASKIAGAKVEFVDGANAGKSATTDSNGNYRITGVASGGFTVRATAAGFREESRGVTVTSNTTVSFDLAISGPRTKFGPGQYHVNSEIAPGRYYAVPSSSCYFERQSGFGGTLDDIIANEFIGFDAGQWIVDIKSSDVGFETDEDCGIWYNSPRAGAQAPVGPGMWLVGSQVRSGTYRASTASGCYWERLRNFSNTIGGVIANDFVANGGSKTVSIRSSDAGFRTDDDCGPWTRSSNVQPESAGPLLDPTSQIEYNWLLNRQRNPRLTTRP